MGKERKSKDKSRKHSSKDVKRGKEKKHKKERRSKHRRRSSSSDSSDGGSGSEPDVNTQLRMGRAAARATREILAYNADLRTDLRELVRQLDEGGALDVSGIPDSFLRGRLATLFDNLVQLRKNSAGQYFKRRGAATTVLSFLVPLLEETAEQLEPYRQASQQHAAEQAAAEAARQAAAAGPPAGAAQQNGQEGEEGGQGAAPKRHIGAAGPPQQQQQQQEGLVDSDEEEEEEGGAGGAAIGPSIGPAAGPAIGPAGPPPGRENGSAEEGLVGGEAEEEEEEEEEDDAVPAGKRVAGPAMPPAEWLAAAAQMEYQLSEEEEEEEEDFLVGPPPPEVAEELDLASMDDRTAEVARVLHVLKLHEAEHAKSSAAEKAEAPPDAYDVLGVEHDAPAGEVKKRYWRLSLLIHPDKCDHPKAHDAFQAVTAAAKELQDAAARKRVDERREEAEMRREFAAQAAQAERSRQWRIARGEATAADLAGPAPAPGDKVARETWMTELPPERRTDGGPELPSGPFKGFSQRGIKSRGDTSAWTMTPQQRALQLEGGPAAAGAAGGGPLLLTGSGTGGADAGVAAANPAAAARMAAAVDAFNSQMRKKSLLEAHAERMAGGGGQEKQGKRKKQKTGDGKDGGKGKDGKGGGKGAAADLGYDPQQHPWRPFDREKDLGPGLQAKQSAAELLKNTRALGSKFSGTQSGGRTFL